MTGPQVATITIRRVPFDGGYAFDVDYAGVPLEDHAGARFHYPGPATASDVQTGLRKIALAIDELEQAGP